MNYRVHLQYEFTALGLDQYLEKLRLTESEELQVQISAYLDNVFDVAALMEDSMTKNAAQEQAQELQEDLGRALDKLNDMEREALYKITELETELNQMRCERDELLEQQHQKDEELRLVKQHEQEWQSRKSILLEWEKLTETLPAGTSLTDVLANVPVLSPKTNGVPFSAAVASQPSPAPPPPPPPLSACMPPPNQPPKAPPKPPSNGAPVPPPPVFNPTFVPDGAMTIKRKHQTKYKMPTLNWIALKPNQVRGTIFNELDDEKLFNYIDFVDFENHFKIGNSLTNGHTDVVSKSIRTKKPENLSLLEHTRLRNIGKKS
jgi:formic-like protein